MRMLMLLWSESNCDCKAAKTWSSCEWALTEDWEEGYRRVVGHLSYCIY
jgi:hypothetical protein